MSPEWNILNRSYLVIREMAGNQEFTATGNELVRSVDPIAVVKWKAVEGPGDKRDETGLRNLVMPGVVVTLLSVKSTQGAGLNCADDEVVRIAIQIPTTTRSTTMVLFRHIWIGWRLYERSSQPYPTHSFRTETLLCTTRMSYIQSKDCLRNPRV